MSFLLFAGNDYYPRGSANDLESTHNSKEEAIAAHDPNKYEYEGGWANILDTETMQVVWMFGRQSGYI